MLDTDFEASTPPEESWAAVALSLRVLGDATAIEGEREAKGEAAMIEMESRNQVR